MNKRIGLFFGGMSNEAEVSIVSARNIAANIDSSKYQLVPIFWTKDGRFVASIDMQSPENGKEILPADFLQQFDVAFPITHGKYGEDGVLQAIFESVHAPYCGCRVLASSLCMDKAVFKTLLTHHEIPQLQYFAVDDRGMLANAIATKIEAIRKTMRTPFFVKPANSGSSVGITKVSDASQLDNAIAIARQHDSKIVLEEGLTDFKEIEIAILGNADIIVSPPGQLKPSQEFYSYDEKYVLNQTECTIPANLSQHLIDQSKTIAEQAYRLCDCKGFARVDLFVKDDHVYLNEINTLPGFTDISMYPRLMQSCDISYTDLISHIIELAY
jgi:D-alanine-D-alanine ligase